MALNHKTCQYCGFWGSPKIPPVDMIEIALWIICLPVGFLFSITRRMDHNMNTCPRCRRQMVKRG